MRTAAQDEAIEGKVEAGPEADKEMEVISSPFLHVCVGGRLPNPRVGASCLFTRLP